LPANCESVVMADLFREFGSFKSLDA